MDDRPAKAQRTWVGKFRNAIRGLRVGVIGQSSFLVHGLAAILVVSVAAAVHVTRVEWCLLSLCITGVLTAEFFNSALESLAKAVDQQSNTHLGAALDIASGAVLVASLGAAVVGLVVLVPHLWPLLFG